MTRKNPALPNRFRISPKLSLAQRLEHYSKRAAKSECLLWQGLCLPNGYGKMTYEGKHLSAHRAAWIAFRGSIPKGLHVCHRCDVRACINVDHLFLGTHADNMTDRNGKGRQIAGPTHWATQITPEMGAEILASQGNQRDIAKRFGTNQTTVWQIKNRTHWTVRA